MQTGDQRLVTIRVQEVSDGHFEVDDGGKASAELFVQGLHLTTARQYHLAKCAEAYGVEYHEGLLRSEADAATLAEIILALAHSIMLASAESVSHEFRFPAGHRTRTRVGQVLDEWDVRWPHHRVERRTRVRGQDTTHEFDYVAQRLDTGWLTVAVKVIPATQTPESQARQYGFLARDIEGTQEEKWPRLAVISRVNEWKKDHLRIVRAHSAAVLELTASTEERVSEVPALVERLARAK